MSLNTVANYNMHHEGYSPLKIIKKKKKAKDLEKVFKEKEKSASWGCLGADFFAHLRGHEGEVA